jgi:hypothetical protein
MPAGSRCSAACTVPATLQQQETLHQVNTAKGRKSSRGNEASSSCSASGRPHAASSSRMASSPCFSSWLGPSLQWQTPEEIESITSTEDGRVVIATSAASHTHCSSPAQVTELSASGRPHAASSSQMASSPCFSSWLGPSLHATNINHNHSHVVMATSAANHTF